MTWRFRYLLAAFFVLPSLASAQTVRVVAGEHADFTRIVLRIPNGVVWSIEGSGAVRRFAPDRPLTYDVTTLFERIPRTRLASVRSDPQGLALNLACDCPIRAWLDRPGLVVLDISDPAAPTDTADAPNPAAPEGNPVARIDVARTARDAGERLARARAELSAEMAPANPAFDSQTLTGLADDLGRQFAQALGQGLLDASLETATRGPVLRTDGVEAELPPNMRIVDVTERPSVDSPPDQAPDPACRGAEALNFLLDRDGPDFAQGLGHYGQALFGEFDQASEQGFLQLVQHYLAAGLGAEARSLIANLRDPLPGRDMLLGFSDILEGRMSNSRMRLADAADCGGLAAVGAILAHPEHRNLAEIAAPIALSYGRLPPTLRAALGLDLVTALIGAGANDEARIVANGLRQSPWASADDIVLVDALLEGGRGDTGRAADHLDSIAMRSVDGTLAWLQLALSEATPVAPSALEDAEALATENRGTEAGVAIMAAAIRLRARSAQPDGALVALDRLETWAQGQSGTRELVTTLRDEIWSILATNADDHALLALTLARSDWLDPVLSLATRQALAARLVDLGFARAAERLLEPETDAQSLRLRAVAALQQDEPETAIQLIEPDDSTEAMQIRAASASRAGLYDEAAALLDAAGIVDAAARAAILDGDWRRLDDLRSRGADTPAVPQDANGFLGLQPGIAEVTLSRIPAATEEPAAQTFASTNETSTDDAPARDPAMADLVPAEPTFDPAEVLDRMGMVSRAGLLLSESERLRAAISVTLQSQVAP